MFPLVIPAIAEALGGGALGAALSSMISGAALGAAGSKALGGNAGSGALKGAIGGGLGSVFSGLVSPAAKETISATAAPQTWAASKVEPSFWRDVGRQSLANTASGMAMKAIEPKQNVITPLKPIQLEPLQPLNLRSLRF